MIDLLKTIVNWLVWSSKNSDKVSLTLKSALAVLVLFGVERAVSDGLADSLMGLVMSLAQAVALAGLVWGAVRKVAITVRDYWEK